VRRFPMFAAKRCNRPECVSVVWMRVASPVDIVTGDGFCYVLIGGLVRLPWLFATYNRGVQATIMRVATRRGLNHCTMHADGNAPVADYPYPCRSNASNARQQLVVIGPTG
jgi:hypothetical protein